MKVSFKKLNPRWQIKNPVMFVVEVGSVITTIEFVRLLFTAPSATFTRDQLTADRSMSTMSHQEPDKQQREEGRLAPEELLKRYHLRDSDLRISRSSTPLLERILLSRRSAGGGDCASIWVRRRV